LISGRCQRPAAPGQANPSRFGFPVRKCADFWPGLVKSMALSFFIGPAGQQPSMQWQQVGAKTLMHAAGVPSGPRLSMVMIRHSGFPPAKPKPIGSGVAQGWLPGGGRQRHEVVQLARTRTERGTGLKRKTRSRPAFRQPHARRAYLQTPRHFEFRFFSPDQQAHCIHTERARIVRSSAATKKVIEEAPDAALGPGTAQSHGRTLPSKAAQGHRYVGAGDRWDFLLEIDQQRLLFHENEYGVAR